MAILPKIFRSFYFNLKLKILSILLIKCVFQFSHYDYQTKYVKYD